MQPKGLICAGGEATRLGELTRVSNKHLLPVGSWPMIYYPLQLLQLAGIRDVLLVTGKGHAGQMIDLLGDGRLAPRGGGDPILEVDLTYKVQTEPGGIAQVVGMARDFAAGAPLVVVLGDNIFEYAQSAALAEWAEDGKRARIFVKDVGGSRELRRRPLRRGRRGRRHRREGGRRRHAVRLRRRPLTPWSASTAIPPDVFDVIARLEPSSRGELEITDVNRHYAAEGRLEAREVEGWWEDAGKHWQHLADIGRRIDETGANK